jgi:hypothetical protein
LLSPTFSLLPVESGSIKSCSSRQNFTKTLPNFTVFQFVPGKPASLAMSLEFYPTFAGRAAIAAGLEARLCVSQDG